LITVVCTQNFALLKENWLTSDNFVISLGELSGRDDLLQEFFSYLRFVTVDNVVHLPQEVANGHEIW
jgi:hypothetical protein